VIAVPLNDRECLGAITEQVAAMVRDRDSQLVALANAHGDTAALAEELRSRPQRDDDGLPCDGPKVEACDPVQRLRIDPPDPNCVERAAAFLGAAELIDPVPVRRLATTNTPSGLHTFPLEDGEPVVLDPYQSRNALAAGLFHGARSTRNGAAPLALTPVEAVDWIAQIATEPAARFEDGERRVRNGHRAVRALLVGRPLCVADVRDVAFMLALADREAQLWGPTGPRLVATTARAVDKLDHAAAGAWKARAGVGEATRNAAELRLGDLRIRPDTGLFGALGRIGGRLGYKAGVEALRVKLATLGVSPPVLTTIEQELNREGLSLGPLAAPPPMIGSLGALTPEALAGRWLARKL
jgi:hypothetical protein